MTVVVKQFWNQRFGWIFLPYVVLGMLHSVFGYFRDIPVIFADELGYLGNARYLAGVSHIPDMHGTTFYHFGYSLFLVPIFHLSADPIIVYKAITIWNAFLISSLYFGIYFVLNRFFQYDESTVAVVAFTTCLYPAYQIQSNIAWAENALIPFYAFLICSFGVLLSRKSYPAAASFGFLSAFLYTIHPRMLPIIPFSTLSLLVLGLRKTLPKSKILLSLAVMTTVFLITLLVNQHLQSIGWVKTGILKYGLSAMLVKLLNLSGIRNYLLLLCGQILYLIQASYGLVPLGFLYMCSLLLSKGKMDPSQRFHTVKRGILFFILFTSVGLFLAITIPMTAGIERRAAGNIRIRGDHLLYGRYLEAFIPLYLAFGLLSFISVFYLNSLKRYKTIVGIIAITVGLTLLVQWGQGQRLLSRLIQMANISGIFAYVRELGTIDLSMISLISILLLISIQIAFKKNFIAGTVLLIALFCSMSVYDYIYGIQGRQDRLKDQSTLAAHIKASNVKNLAYDVSFGSGDQYFLYQYLLPAVVFQRFDSEKGDTPPTETFTSGREWNRGRKLKAKLLACEKGNVNCLWRLRRNKSGAFP